MCSTRSSKNTPAAQNGTTLRNRDGIEWKNGYSKASHKKPRNAINNVPGQNRKTSNKRNIRDGFKLFVTREKYKNRFRLTAVQ